MTEQNTTVHHQTKRGADISLAKKEISPQSHAAIMEGRLALAEAKSLGRDRGPDTTQASSGQRTVTRTQGRASDERSDGAMDTPPQPSSRISKGDRSRECMCGCGERTAGGRFRMGHDMRMVSLAKAHLRGEAELSEEQLAYLQDSGKLERARQQIEKEEARRQERIAAKTERKREGEAERRKRNAK